jgi:hypothetical protein
MKHTNNFYSSSRAEVESKMVGESNDWKYPKAMEIGGFRTVKLATKARRISKQVKRFVARVDESLRNRVAMPIEPS